MAGILLAGVAYWIFLRRYSGDDIPANERRVAPLVALAVVGIVGVGVVCYWVAYRLTGAA